MKSKEQILSALEDCKIAKAEYEQREEEGSLPNMVDQCTNIGWCEALEFVLKGGA